jgi:hypothetical protein
MNRFDAGGEMFAVFESDIQVLPLGISQKGWVPSSWP